MYNSTVRETIFRKSYVYESSIVIKHFHLFVGYLSLVLFVIDGFIAFLVLDTDGVCIIPDIICGWILHNPLYNLWMRYW
jgi:hypothetical protein